MTTVGLLARRSAHGLDAPADERLDWRRSAACVGRWGMFTEQMSANATAAAGAHRCVRHCPVLVQCTESTEAPGKRPQDMVQAGLWWPAHHHRDPVALPDPGCGPHCAETRGIRRGR